MYFKINVKYNRPVEGSDDKKPVTEVYLFDAVNFTDAEIFATNKFKYILPEGGEFKIDNITKFKIETILNESDESGLMFYLSKNTYLVEQEDATFKKQNFNTLVFASSLPKAVEFLTKWFEGNQDETYISAIAESKILEVFRPVDAIKDPLKGNTVTITSGGKTTDITDRLKGPSFGSILRNSPDTLIDEDNRDSDDREDHDEDFSDL